MDERQFRYGTILTPANYGYLTTTSNDMNNIEAVISDSSGNNILLTIMQKLTSLEESVKHIQQLLENVKTSLTWETCVLNGVQDKNTETSIKR